ncbi:MAG: hypothetical protein KDJ97_37155 [Anaerolineae bacterium]|nr:hypothetical protein [Anaerolineae bacterium]
MKTRLILIVGLLISLILIISVAGYFIKSTLLITRSTSQVEEILQIVSPENTPPTCFISATNPDSPKSIEITIQDSPGLSSIEFRVLASSNVTINIPALDNVNLHEPLIIKATKTDQSKNSQVLLLVEDISSSKSSCGTIKF